jgi:hypothetical protein
MADTKEFILHDDQKSDKGRDATDAPGEQKEHISLPEINLSTFLLSLNASALLNLGAIDDPATGGKNKNLLLGKQTIDILSMLKEKTDGNLTDDEKRLIENILYELRIIYVKEKS